MLRIAKPLRHKPCTKTTHSCPLDVRADSVGINGLELHAVSNVSKTKIMVMYRLCFMTAIYYKRMKFYF